MKLFGAMTSLMTVGAALALAPTASAQQTVQAFSMGPQGFVQFTAESRSFLGVGAREIDSERAKAMKLKDEYGVEITRIDEDSPAEHAGMKVGDVVIAFNGQRVEGTEQFIRFVRETPAGRGVKLTVVREGTTQDITVVVGSRQSPMQQYGVAPDMHVEVPNMSITIPDMPKAMMSWRNASLGVEAESLGDTQLATYFGVKDGVLVRSVFKGTAAEKAGLKAGDVILKVDQESVSTPREVTSAVRSARNSGKKAITVVAMRERKQVNVSVNVQDTVSSSNTLRQQRRATSVANQQ